MYFSYMWKDRFSKFCLIAAMAVLLAAVPAGCRPRHDDHLSSSLDCKTALKSREDDLSRYTSTSLVKVADSLYEDDSHRDKASMLYKVVTSRKGGDADEVRSRIKANLKLWERYTFDFHDVSKAMEYLNSASDLASADDECKAQIDYAYAVSYQNMGNHTRDKELYDKALRFYERAFAGLGESQEEKPDYYDRMTTNYLTLLFSMQRPIDRRSFNTIRTVKNGGKENVSPYNINLYEGFTALQSGDHRKAASRFRAMRNGLKSGEDKELYLSLLNEATALQQGGRISDALKVLSEADSVTVSANNIEMLVSLSFTKSKYYELAGNREAAEQASMEYYRYRDSLLTYRQVTGLREAEFTHSLSKLDARIAALSYEGKIKTVVIASAILLLLVLTASIIVIRRKNRTLREANRSLYEQNREVMAAEQREREERLRVAELLKSRNTPEKREKYQGRRLDESVKKELHNAVIEVMQTNDEIYRSDFSLSRLSEICGSKPEYVSQVINEMSGCNFNELLNKYRIREACRRISDRARYGQYTLAAIAAGVGIESATTFSKYFKIVTGLTPSQYKKTADSQE